MFLLLICQEKQLKNIELFSRMVKTKLEIFYVFALFVGICFALFWFFLANMNPWHVYTCT